MSKEVLQGTKPIIEDYRFQGLFISFTNPCNILISPMRKPKGEGGSLSRTSEQEITLFYLDNILFLTLIYHYHPFPLEANSLHNCFFKVFIYLYFY